MGMEKLTLQGCCLCNNRNTVIKMMHVQSFACSEMATQILFVTRFNSMVIIMSYIANDLKFGLHAALNVKKEACYMFKRISKADKH